MRLVEARAENGWLCFRPASMDDAYRTVYGFKEGDYDLVAHREKRSKTANAYAWELMGQIAARLHVPVVEVYRNAIDSVSVKSEILECRSDAVEMLRDLWCGDHLGRSIRVISNDDGRATVLATYGSSDFDKQQMGVLIDHILQDCAALGIETKPQGYIDSLLEAWHD